MRSKIAANLNVLEFVKIVGEICKTLGVRWSNYGVTAPSQACYIGMLKLLFLALFDQNRPEIGQNPHIQCHFKVP